MRNGKLRIVIGIILVLLQVVAVLGLEETNKTLDDFTEIGDSYLTAKPIELTTMYWFYGFYAGRDLFDSVFEQLPAALEEEGFYYNETVPELMTERIRDGLTAGNHIFQRNLYNLNLRIGFNLFGILGAILILSGILAWRRSKNTKEESGYIDSQDSKFAAKLRIPAAIVCWGCTLWRLPFTQPILPADLIPMATFGCLAVFFSFYYGKKPSVLPAAALLLWGAERLDTGIWSFFPFIGANTEVQLIYYGLTLLLFTVVGILFLLCGRKLLKSNSKKPLQWLFTIAGAAELVFSYYYLYQFRKVPLLLLRISEYLPLFFFLVLLGLYIWLVKEQIVEKEIPVPQREPVPAGACHICRAPLNPGKDHCSRCGAPQIATAVETVLPKTPTETSPATTPVAEPAADSAQTASFCYHCGNPIAPGHRFCIRCGKPVWQATTKE